MKNLIALVAAFVLAGCVATENPMATYYGAEAVGLTAWTLADRADDVVVVFGRDGAPNRIFPRRGDLTPIGPNADLKVWSPKGTDWWDYTEDNRSFQIYSSAKVAAYGKHADTLVWSDGAKTMLDADLREMQEDYPGTESYQRFEYMLRRQAQFEEARSAWKQERKALETR